MIDSFSILALSAAAVVFAGVSKGGFGSGASFASASMLALVMPPGQALGLLLPLLMLIDVASLKPYWRKWDVRQTWMLCLAAVPGVSFGALFYTMVNEDGLRLLIGLVSLGFVIWQLRPRGVVGNIRLPMWAGCLAGFAGGFTSFVSHAGGPPVAVYLLSLGLRKTTYQATTVLVFWCVNVMKAVPYAFLGIFTVETLLTDLVLVPFAFLGTWLGVKAHYAVSERVFFALTYLLLTATGCKLIWDAMT
ncbi:sulfite exporter TauE/SafE family protein [Shimia sp.]|uniref:sulfite exporter TauE/SafE family protein n=1 Tax=Shimia sp. TaxID=1954381 RepID=UPI003298DDCB